MSTSGLTPPGSATYDSGTMYVGDGTWDADDNTFLLPNLQGLNYATTRYNGMGNRFKDLPGYYNMVVAHGVLAALTFLFIVPIGIMVNRFYWRNYYWKLRIHIWAQILTVLLSTVVFILGFFQVGPRRSLTNPHHGIGVALYVLVLVQFVGGYLNYKVSKGRPHDRRLLRIVLHQWIGRIIGLLGITQVALGLTLYGSPLSLFILYAIAVFALILAYFIFDFVNTTSSSQHHDQVSYVSGPANSAPSRPNRTSGLMEGALAGGLLGALASRFRNRKQPPHSEYGSDVSSHHESHAPSGRQSNRPTRPAGESNVTGDYTEYTEKAEEKPKHTWRDRLLGLGALGGLGYWLSRRKKPRAPSEYDGGSSYYYYGSGSSAGGEALSRVEEGRPMTPAAAKPTGSALNTPNSQDRLTRPAAHRPSYSNMSESSYASGSPSKVRPQHPVRDGLFGLGALGAAKGLFDWRKRRERKEQRRIEELRRQEAEDEYLQRRKSKKYTGDGPSRRSGRASQSAAQSMATGSVAPSAITASAMSPSAMSPSAMSPSPMPPSAMNPSALTPSGFAPASTITPVAAAATQRPGTAPSFPPPPTGPHVMAGALQQSTASLVPPPPIRDPGSTAISSPNSRPSTAAGGPQGSYTNLSAAEAAGAGLAGAAAGGALGAASHNRRSRDNSRVRPGAAEGAPATPVSVKLNMHPDGRHVTLRRLTEEEAAKEREAKERDSKRTRNRNRRQRAGSIGDTSLVSDAAAGSSPDQRWRRPGGAPGSSPPAVLRPGYAASSAAGSAAVPPPPAHASYPSVPRPSSVMPPSTVPSPAPYPTGQHINMPQSGIASAMMSNASLMPPGSVSTLPGRPGVQGAGGSQGLVSHPGSVASPGAYDTTTDTQASQMSAFAENRRRRRAQRAQANLAKQKKEGDRSVEFDE